MSLVCVEGDQWVHEGHALGVHESLDQGVEDLAQRVHESLDQGVHASLVHEGLYQGVHESLD